MLSVSKQCQKHNQNHLYSALSDVGKVLVNTIGKILKRKRKKKVSNVYSSLIHKNPYPHNSPRAINRGWTTDHVLCTAGLCLATAERVDCHDR